MRRVDGRRKAGDAGSDLARGRGTEDGERGAMRRVDGGREAGSDEARGRERETAAMDDTVTPSGAASPADPPPPGGPAPAAPAGDRPAPRPAPGTTASAEPVTAPGDAGTGPGTDGEGGRAAGRRVPVIGNETTGPIPVHLLFRDDDQHPAAGAVPGTRPWEAARPRESGRGRVAVPRRAVPRAARPTVAAPAPVRPGPAPDPALVERPGTALPGSAGVAAGVLGLAGCAAVLWWTGVVPEEVTVMLGLSSPPYHGIPLARWVLLTTGVLVMLIAFGGLGRGRVGHAWVLTLFGDYRGTVRRTGLMWVSPLLLRRRVDVRLRHWRSEPLPAVDARGTALRVVALVVWRLRDTVRAVLGVADHERYLREQVEAALARVLSQLPADAFREDTPTLRDAEAVGAALTRMLAAECAPVGIDVFSAQPTRIEYAPELAAAMRRRRIAAIEAEHRDTVLTSVVDAVDGMVHRLTTRGLVELDDYDRKTLVKDLTVALCAGRAGPVEGP